MHDPSGHGQDAQAESFRFVVARVSRVSTNVRLMPDFSQACAMFVSGFDDAAEQLRLRQRRHIDRLWSDLSSGPTEDPSPGGTPRSLMGASPDE